MIVGYAEVALLVLRVSLFLQIKNTLHLAAYIAAAEQEDLSSSHICATLAANGRLGPDCVSDSANELYESRMLIDLGETFQMDYQGAGHFRAQAFDL